MRREFKRAALVLIAVIVWGLLAASSTFVGRAQDPQWTPYPLEPALSWAEMQALDNLSVEVIESIQKSCCLGHGQVWVTESAYVPGGCVLDAFNNPGLYDSYSNCERAGYRAAIGPVGDEITPEPVPTDTPSSEGVQFTIRVAATGYESREVTLFTEDYDPSRIEIGGRVTGETGEAIAGATVTLVDLGETVSTAQDGSYWLSVETVGSKPYTQNLDWTLVKLVTDANVTLELPDVIPAPGEASLTVQVTDEGGKPLPYLTAVVTLVDSEKLPFVALEKDRSWLDEQGRFVTKLTVRDPSAEYVYVKEIPLQLTLSVEIWNKDESRVLSMEQVTRPFNLALIHGVTVGPGMEPREEAFEPLLDPYAPGAQRFTEVAKTLFVGAEKNSQGDFWVLVRPYRPDQMRPPPDTIWHIRWSVLDRLPLYYPLPRAPVPGEKMELGKIDVLTPEEHEERLKSIVRQFIQRMPLTANARSDALNGLNDVRFTYHSTGAVPFFQDDMTGFGGAIVTPHSKEEYWGLNLVNGEDAAYVIMLHELGHFLHHALVERHFYLNVCYNKLATGEHRTWQAPADKTETGAKYLSFAESQADFYAYVAHSFWEQQHAEIKDSIYFKRVGYLPEFDNDDKALAVIDGGTSGFRVEGVQTRFLSAFYGDGIANNPVRVYSDYLATMLLYMDTPEKPDWSLVRRPARTIQQWVYAKSGGKTEERIFALASRYRLFADPVPVIMPTTDSTTPLIRIADKTFDFADFPVEHVPFGVEVEVKSGLMNVDLSTSSQRRTLYLGAGSLIVLHDDRSVEVKKGMVGADFGIVFRTPSARVEPAGTVFTVEVAENGATHVRALDGQVVVQGSAGTSRKLNAGEQVEVSAGGELGASSAFEVAADRAELLPKLDMPFDLDVLGVGAEEGKVPALGDGVPALGDEAPLGGMTDPLVLLLGAGVTLLCGAGFVGLIMLAVATRRRRKRRAARGRPARPRARVAELVVLQGPQVGQRLALQPSTRLGRAPDNELVLDDPQVSRHHAVIAVTDLGYLLTDLGSSNGTLVNGVRISAPQQLRPGDVIVLGSQSFEFRG